MGKELIVSSDRHETKVAILEDGQLVEVYFQRGNEYSLAGSIHKGRVTRVLPGMQSAFVDLGLERDTFLYVSDFTEEHGEEVERIPEDRRGKPQPHRREVSPVIEAPAEVAPVVVSPLAEPALESSAEGEPAHESREGRRFDNQDRRGRRRRRRGGGRFPDAKFATSSEAAAPAIEHEEVAAGGEGEAHEPILLPGESLRKYKREQSATIAPDSAAELAGELLTDNDEPETAVQLVAPVPEPDAPLHHPESSEVEVTTDAAAEIEQSDLEEVDPIEAEPAEEPVAALERAEAVPISTEEISDAPELEVAAEEFASDEARAAGDATEDSEKAAGQPALEPMGYSAHIREQSGRFLQQRSGRRGRRRGRGRDDRGERHAEQRPEARTEAQPEGKPEPRKEELQDRGGQPSITDLLKEGQEILVQIAKEPLGQKGARITSHIALPGRYCVYMPTVEHTGVSRKIASDEERQRLKRILQTHKQGIPGGFILRTAGEGKSETEIAADIHYLYNLWLDIRQKAEKRKAPALIYHDLDIVERTLRDQLSEDFKAIWCDSEERYESILQFVQRVQPSLVSRVKMFTRPLAIFDAFSVTAELEKALRPKVWLKSGGYIVINQTEALVAIDINTGKFVGKSNRLEDTIVKINTEAVKEIVRQIRLRDLGGIIVIDFIDMDERKNRQKVMQALEEAMRADRAPYKILQFNDFGLVAITRKRVKQSLERTLCQPCPHCEGAGYIKSVQTIISEIIGEARKIAAAVDGKECVLRVNPDVAKVLQSTGNTYLEEMEEILKRPVAVVADGVLHHEKFDLS